MKLERIDDMKFNIHGRKIDVTDSIKSYIEEKIGRLDKYFENPDDVITTAVIKLRGKDQQVVEITINANKFMLRGEESHKDLYASIDKVSDKIERQIRKNKTRLKKKTVKDISRDFVLDFEEPEENDNVIVKRKTIQNKPMSEEEAILQMELLGHEFFAFKNMETSEVNILYRRKDGDYGIIELK
jgi:putative sigma-54 modulation protein